jgi:hypothetical protein
MDNFNDPNESEFSGFAFKRHMRAIIPRVGIVLRIETELAPTAQPSSAAPSLQVVLTIAQARQLADGLLHSVEAAQNSLSLGPETLQ